MVAVLGDGWRAVRWWFRGVLGADAYEQYLARHARTGHDHPPMDERAFWRARSDHQDRHPEGRCC
ncbi:MAG: hypothetical protein AVDCRST_MAG54-2148 [uncultured Actinomycetospora sp.]|uniref:Small protein yjiX n=1 Tax=uncultured Actinomycetospora sp. TaxID=1135996 RepID=A0A6J4IM87_9PSEU|nr:MAG: hypothetical protein AVDCRST_MAG54-2148 [uncultured Actinomycetospora sp.]